MEKVDRFLGCMYGLAVGDALGAPGEFLDQAGIKAKYGPDGIREFEPWHNFPGGSYTDDTQMSLATGQGILMAKRYGIPVVASVYEEYKTWSLTQNNPQQRRAPGHTCMSALESGQMGTIKRPINNSKGCGGVMRVAPAGLVWEPDKAFAVAAECAAITHGHPTGYLAAGTLAHVISLLVDGVDLEKAVTAAAVHLVSYEDHTQTWSAIMKAQTLAQCEVPAEDAIPKLGQGWVAEEALSIAIFCALSYPDNWLEGVLAAVNITGDSDSTGSITGAILGTLLGYTAIPDHLLAEVEQAKQIKQMALELHKLQQDGGRNNGF